VLICKVLYLLSNFTFIFSSDCLNFSSCDRILNSEDPGTTFDARSNRKLGTCSSKRSFWVSS